MNGIQGDCIGVLYGLKGEKGMNPTAKRNQALTKLRIKTQTNKDYTLQKVERFIRLIVVSKIKMARLQKVRGYERESTF